MTKKIDFLLSKTGYLALIKLIRDVRFDTFGKRGEIKIPRAKIKKIKHLELNKSLKQLIRDRILKKTNTRNNKKNKYIKINCEATYEEIDDYLNSLTIPGGYGLIVELTSHDVYVIYRHSEEENSTKLSVHEGEVMNYLYKYRDQEIKKEILKRECGLNSRQISAAITSVRRKLVVKLEFADKEAKRILPWYTRGYNILRTH